MTTFPSVRPSSRMWSPGSRAQTVQTAMDGIEVRFVHGDRSVGQRLSLTFNNITEAAGKSITDHYIANGTTYGTFDVPAELFAGMSTYNYVKPAGNSWRYESPPQVTYGVPGYQSVTVELIAVTS